MNWLKRLFDPNKTEETAPTVAPTIPTPIPSSASPNPPAGDNKKPSFTDQCFIPISSEFEGMADEEEPRLWYELKDLESIPSLANSGETEAALTALEQLSNKYKDYYFIYGWKISLLVGNGDLFGAREALLEGLRASKRKSSLCANYATAVFNNQGPLEESILWWIISAQMQLKTTHWTTHDPFLYLSYVAKYAGDSKLADRLLELSDTARPGDMLRLNSVAEESIATGLKKTRDAGLFADIETALVRLKTMV